MLPVFAPHTHTHLQPAFSPSLTPCLQSQTHIHTRARARELRPGRGSASARRVSPHRIAALPPQPPSHSRSPSFLARPDEWMPVTSDTVPSTLGGSLGVAFSARNTSSRACFFRVPALVSTPQPKDHTTTTPLSHTHTPPVSR